jgi:excisionase family DNA binding protein
MSSRRAKWAVNLPNGTPLIVNGAIVEVDDATGTVTLDQRSQEIIDEILEQDPQSTDSIVVPGIDLAHEVYNLIQAKHEAGIPVNGRLPPKNRETSSGYESHENAESRHGISPSVQETIDRTLRLIFSQSHRYLLKLGQSVNTPSVTELRNSPIGKDLARLASIAAGHDHADREETFRMVNSVLELLFWPAGEDEYQAPRAFWEEPLGKLLSQAKLRSVDASELMSVGNAAQILGVTRPTIYRWMDDHTLNYVRDDLSGRTFVLRGDVETLRENISREGGSQPNGVQDSRLASIDYAEKQ